MESYGVGLEVSTVREAKYVEASVQRFLKMTDWKESYLPEDERLAIDECNAFIHRAAVKSDKNVKDYLNGLRLNMREDLLPDGVFEWIRKGGDRAAYFVGMSLAEKFGFKYVYHGEGVAFASRFLDLSRHLGLNLNRENKAQILSELRQKYSELEPHRWLDSLSDKQMDWAVNYLCKHSIARPVVGDPPPENADIRALRDYVYGSFDFPNISGAELREFTRSMKGALASKKNREKGKTLNCQIMEQRSNQLAELAEYYDCSKAKMIERLIKWKYQKLKSERLI